MLGIGTGELLLILVIAVLVVGPEKMVEFASQAGRWLAKFRQMTEGVTKEFNEAIALEVDKAEKGEGEASVEGATSPEVAQIEAGPAVAAESATPSALLPPVAPTVEIVVDGETEPISDLLPTASPENAPSAEPVAVEVAQLVPEDEEVEPMPVGEVVLIADEPAPSDSAESKG
jgi:sec-independent protein translocase protein TatB